jgi:cytochrome b561
MDGLQTIFLHKSLGLTVFAVVLLRLGWRLTHRPPPLPETTPPWQRRAATVVHGSFYGFLLGLPILGYLLSLGSPFPLEWFGHELPKAKVPKQVSDTADGLHVAGGLILTGLLVLHIGAALWHQFVRRDRLIARMRIG